MVAYIPWHSLDYGCITAISSSIITSLTSLCVLHVFKSLSLFMRASVIGFRAHLNPAWPHFNLITSAKTLFSNMIIPIESGERLKTEYIFWGNTIYLLSGINWILRWGLVPKFGAVLKRSPGIPKVNLAFFSFIQDLMSLWPFIPLQWHSGLETFSVNWSHLPLQISASWR